MTSTFLDLTNPNQQNSGFLQDVSGNTLFFALSNAAGGSGQVTEFLRLKSGQGSLLEKGYNTNGKTEFDTQKQGTKIIRLSDLPTLNIDNATYYEFRINLNESSSHPQIDLTKLQIFQSNVANLTGYNSSTGQLAGLNPVIHLNTPVKLNANLTTGNGSGDVSVYLPTTAFSGNPYLYAYAEFQGADSGFETFSYSTSARVKSLADLSLTQTISNPVVLVGDTVTFTITIKNDGPNQATNIAVQDLLPPGLQFHQATSSQGTYNPTTGLWSVGSIATSSNATLRLTGTVLSANTASAYTNIAEIVAANPLDPDSTVNNGVPTEDDYSRAVLSVINLDLQKEFTQVTKVVDGDANGTPEQFLALPGDQVQYTITVTNQGTGNATNVVIHDDLTPVLPVGLTLQSLELDGGINQDSIGQGDGNSQTIEVLFNTIAPGASKTITVNAKVSNDYLTPIKFAGKINAEDPATGSLNPSLLEYYDTIFEGTLFLNYNVQKGINESIANFGFLNVTNQAEIVSVNQQTLNPGSITDEARLDVSTYTIQGKLGNGEHFNVYSIENLLDSNNNSGAAFEVDPDPILSSGSKGYPYYNQSKFLPPGTTGIAGLLGEWLKINEPEYLGNIAAWNNLSADGDLSNTQDEQTLITTFKNFIEDGVYRRDNYDQGSFSFNNRQDSQELTFEGGEISLISENFVNVLVTDSGVVVTNEFGTVIATFTDLQTTLDTFDFTNTTGLKITLKDSNGDGIISSRLQELNGANFEAKWYIQDITVDANVNKVIFSSKNGSSNLNLSFIKFLLSEPKPNFQILGDNAKDEIVGTLFNDNIRGLNGNDYLVGVDGDDVISGEQGQDILEGGRGNDQLIGGSSIDTFIFGGNFGNDMITDFTSQDILNFQKLSLNSKTLDSNSDGVINALDDRAGITNGNLLIDLTSVQGGTLILTGVTSVNMSAVIL